MAAVLPLPKKRGVVAPKGFTRRYGNSITSRISIVARDGLDACVYQDIVPPKEKTPPATAKPQKQLPGEEFESAKPLPPLNEGVNELLSESEQPLVLNVPAPATQSQPVTNEATPPPEPAEEAPPPPPAGQ